MDDYLNFCSGSLFFMNHIHTEKYNAIKDIKPEVKTMIMINEDEILSLTDDKFNDDRVSALQREITAENALIEDTFQRNRTAYVTISYGVPERNRTIRMRVVTLVIDDNTRIRDQFGNRIGFRDLRAGMVVDARFSSDMTRSDPPQTRAFGITIIKESSSSLIVEARVLRVSVTGDLGYILTGVPFNPNRQMRYAISRTTKLRDRRGNRIPLRFILPGQFVRIEREPFQTMSIPPQTSALSVQIISG